MLKTTKSIYLPQRSPSQSATPQLSEKTQAVVWHVLFLLAHVPLGFLLQRSSQLTTLHALAVFALGVRWALANRVERAAWVCAYIVGAELLWRMTDARIFWEFGKYGVAAILLLAIIRDSRGRLYALPSFYFLLLTPAAALAFDLGRPNASRELISFHLSGPFALTVSVCFFASFRLQPAEIQRLWWMVIAPLLSVVTIIVLKLNSLDSIYFGRSSSALLSGGFGPNQVSNMLGVGAVATFLLLSNPKTSHWLRLLLGGLLLSFAAFSALTFSRGGLYAAVGSIVIYSLLLLRDGRSRLGVLLMFTLLLAAANYFVLPRLNSFTQGAMVARFQDPSTTGRFLLIEGDLLAFRENLLTGAGLGGSRIYHAYFFRASAAHTEFSRMLAEHGLWGLGALLLLLLIAWRHFLSAPTIRNRATVAALIVSSFLFMMQAGMRLAAPSFFFGLAALFAQPDAEPDSDDSSG